MLSFCRFSNDCRNHNILFSHLFTAVFFEKQVVCSSVSTWHTIKTDCTKLLIRTVDQEICSFDFLENGLGTSFPHHVLCMNFQEKCFSHYILLTEQILLSDYLYVLIYWAICVCFPGCEITSSFNGAPITLFQKVNNFLKSMVFFERITRPILLAVENLSTIKTQL